MKKLHSLFIVLAVALVIIAIAITLGINNSDSPSVQQENSSNQIAKIISQSELTAHNAEEDCWIIYQDKVYDLTDWLQKHPGGVKSISGYCGTDGFEAAFIKKHGTSKADLFMKVAVYMGDTTQQGVIDESN